MKEGEGGEEELKEVCFLAQAVKCEMKSGCYNLTSWMARGFE